MSWCLQLLKQVLMIQKNNLAIIPARGGSKSIPNKNLTKVGNISLVQRSIICAFKSGCNNVYVSSDSIEIGKVAEGTGAIFIRRPAEISGDNSSTESAVKNVLEQIKITNKTKIALLQPTSPFTSPQDLSIGLDKIMLGTSTFSALEFHNFLWISRDSKWEPWNHSKKLRIMKEQLPKIVVETGNFYCFNAYDFLEEVTRFCKNSFPSIIDPMTALQIDSVRELDAAERMASIFNS